MRWPHDSEKHQDALGERNGALLEGDIMKPEPFVVTRQSYATALDVVGVQVTILASNDKTGGYEITLQEGPEGAGPVPHAHPWDESFFVLRGTVELHCSGQSVTAEQGTLVHFPAGTVHGYRFGAHGGAMLELSGPGGLATKMFELIAKNNPRGPAETAQLFAALQTASTAA
jgi:quercetin dioxygenase-like cupin family protein